MLKKYVQLAVCSLVILGFGISTGYSKTTTDANSPTCKMKALLKKCGLNKKAADANAVDANTVDPNSKKTGFINSLKKKCGLDKKACCTCKGCPASCKCPCCLKKKTADANAVEPNTVDPNANTGVVNSMMKKCGLKKGCGKKCADVCKCVCCKKTAGCTVADANAVDPNSKKTGCLNSLKKKCGLEKKACSTKK